MGQRTNPINLGYTGSCYGPSPSVVKAIKSEIKNVNAYPNEGYMQLKAAIAKYSGVKPENVVVTNGCDEAIALVTYLFGQKVLIQAPTYSEFERIARGINAEIRIKRQSIAKSPYRINFTKSDLGWASLAWICSPNNPTGDVIPREKILEVVKAAKGIVAVDEAYYEYSKESVVDSIGSFNNLIVTRTFSKAFATEGIRLGYAIANKGIISALENSTQEFNVNRFSRAAGLAVLKSMGYYKKEMLKLRRIKANFESRCSSLGIRSNSHNLPFSLLLFDSDKERDAIYKGMVSRGVNVFRNTYEEFTGFDDPAIRVAIGNKRQMDAAVSAIEETLRENAKTNLQGLQKA